VVVNLGALFKQSEKPAEWEGAKVAL
jgi:hypothetical protein